jgi:hypothetical protein
MTVSLTAASNHLLGVDPFLKVVTTVAIVFMTFALVGLAAGMGARHPRFSAENLTQVAGSYGGIAFMVQAVLFIVVVVLLIGWPSSIYLWSLYRDLPLSPVRRLLMGACFVAAAGISVLTCWLPLRRGVRALEEMD